MTNSFTSMDTSTAEQWGVIGTATAANQGRVADRVLAMLESLSDVVDGFAVDQLTHSLQTATRALRDGRDEEYVVCALLHDVAESIGPFNHGEIAAAILKPFVSVENYWMLAHHQVFQVYFFGRHLGLDPNERDAFVASPFYDRTVDFTALYDEVSFDPDYDTEPMSTFEPMVRRVLAKDWTPPA